MKIWVLGRSYPTKQNKMRGSFELEQAQLLSRYGENKVTYIACVFHPINKIRKWGYANFKDGDVKVYVRSVPFAPERMHIHLRNLQGAVWRQLLKKVADEDGIPDIIHVHYPGMVSIADAVLEYKNKGTKIITTDHWTKTLQNNMDSFQRKQLKQYAEEADKIICVSQALKEAIQRITGTKKDIRIVPNVVSNLFTITENKKAAPNYNFVAVGRLVPVKQIDQIVLAFSKVFAGQVNVTLTVVGNGPEYKKIKKIIRDFNAESQIELAGTLTREQTAEKVKKSDCLICFSRLETFGVPVIEAWACGKPVVASSAVQILDDWDEDLGYLIPYNDTMKLQSTLERAYKEKDKFNAKKIADFASNNFGEKAIYRKLMNIYCETNMY